MTEKTRFVLAFKIFHVFLIITLSVVFQNNGFAQNRKKVEILHCDLLDHNSRIIANAQRLLGNVNITVDGALMWCDSLYSYTNNTVDAFGSVHIVRGDTLNMYADYINYSGETKLAKARRNVKLIDKQMTLTTDSLDYSMTNDLASYNYSGTLKDSTNVLTSVIGQYFVNQKKAYFKTNVDGTTKDYKIKSDNLIYYTNSKKVYIEGPTRIFNEKDTLYAEYGWYDSMKNYARLTKKPQIWNVKQNVKADSIYYDKRSGDGEAMGHARIQDFENSIIVKGNRVRYNDLTKTASANDSAVFIQYSKTDSLYLHADYLRAFPDTTKTKISEPVKKSKKNTVRSKTEEAAKVAELNIGATKTPEQAKTNDVNSVVALSEVERNNEKRDSAKIEKDPRIVLAYNKVRFFRSDMQGKCDSLVYWSKDSTIQMFTEPVIWSNKNQVSAKYMEIIRRSKGLSEIRMKDDAFIIAMEDDSIRFNQIKGRNMTGFIRTNQLEKINVDGNGESNYYARDKDGIIGLNKAQGSNIVIYMNKGKIKKISFINSPEGILKPLQNLEANDKLLSGFNWQERIRPKTKDDIFIWPKPEEKTDKEKPEKNKVQQVRPATK